LNLEDLVAQFSARSLPPVSNWHPQHQRSIDMRVDRAGVWHYQGSPIQRQRMVALFSSVLRREGQQYFLVTPAEKLEIVVELAPFVALLLDVTGEGTDQQLMFTDNCGNQTLAGADHRLWMAQHPDEDGDEVPLLDIRDNLPALVSRPVYYQLADLIVEHDAGFGVWSDGQFFVLANEL
jgi:hypothetical protein